MKAVKIQFNIWDKFYYFDPGSLNLTEGDYVLVKTYAGTELGKVIGFDEKEPDQLDKNYFKEEENRELKTEKFKPILNLASKQDLEKIINPLEKKKALCFCNERIRFYNLPMKLVDAHFSYDGSRMTFAFVADGRVDFRELVKDLTRHFNRLVRLHQIGIRDEAKINGDFGHCGKELCCKTFLKDLESITSDMAECQEVAHRGSERISGICGRLMCCLAFEQCGYKYALEKMPKIGDTIKFEGKKGVVVAQHPIKQTVKVEFEAENSDNGLSKNIIEISLDKIK